MNRLPLVLLSGWGVSPEIFTPWIDQLESQFEVRVLSYPDFEEAQSLTRSERSARLAQSIAEPSILLGWSLGGQFALDFASDYPEKILGVILLGTNPCFVANDGWQGMEPEQFEQFRVGMSESAPKTLSRFAMLVASGSDELRVRLAQLKTHLYPPSDLLACLLDELRIDRREIIQQCQSPILMLLADKDQLVPVGLAEDIAASEGVELQRIADSSHLMFLDQPERCIDCIGAWIETRVLKS